MARTLSLLDLDQARSFYEKGHWQPSTLYMRLRHWAEIQPEHHAIRDTESRLTYREALQWVDTIAADLHAAGLRQGDRVSIWLPSRAESVLVLLACSRMGYVCNPSLHRDYTCAEIRILLERVSAAAFFGQPGHGADSDRHDIFALLSGLPSLKKTYRLPPLAANELSGNPAKRCGELSVRESGGLGFSSSPDRVMYLAFTSGTTGLPKGVMHSDNTLLSNGRAIVSDFGFDAKTVIYTLSPMSHNMGTVALVTALACGGELVVHSPLDGRRTLDRIIETGATYLIGVPTHAIDLLTEVHKRGLTRIGDVSSFQLAGSPIPAATVRALLALGITPQSCYGMTENCSFQYTRPDDPPEIIINSCGRSCDGFELKVWDPENPDRELEIGETGELGGRGCCLMLGYFDDQIGTERSFNRSGWFMTGDLGEMDRHGNLRIVGRKKDLIIRGGHNIHPARIEDLAMRHPSVLKAAAFPVADPRLGEKVCLALVMKEPREMPPSEILAHLDAMGLSKYDMPEYFVQLDHFPLTASGKVLKRRLVEDAANGVIRPAPVRFRPQPARDSLA
ncbi:class I adenylate-forming enzyme family protein [Bradyrhizobium sp. NP1]|uniref:class I adenylate-forming enzyme family protein n=1 Tax=Bradyrhizobium sp. NP1 TaxID=3049772 RepID=UPI0025A63968|nr:class I adenylate-forming enzyme family protein [Bradyrhizobium sp. NP1]WJR79147.1 class I adenylate-forming enzyme family protein [Bradyrhizobium sp. NP1]